MEGKNVGVMCGHLMLSALSHISYVGICGYDTILMLVSWSSRRLAGVERSVGLSIRTATIGVLGYIATPPSAIVN